MNRDRSWMNHNGVKDRRKPEYKAGVDEFLEFAFWEKNGEKMLKCPCLNCRLGLAQNRKTMQCHLLVYGIDSSYNPWVSHGESVELNDSSEDENIAATLETEEDEMPFDDMAPLVFDATNLWNSDNSRFNDGEEETMGFESAAVNDDTPKINEPSSNTTQDLEGAFESLDNQSLDNQQNPLYVRLFEKTKRHKITDENSAWGPSDFGPNDEKHFEELKKLHETEIEKHGEDTLNLKDGYVRGLGPGARQPKKGETEGENSQLASEIQQLKDAATLRESQIETLKASNDDLLASNEELKASNEELKASISQINNDAIEREKKLRDDVQKMFDEMR